MTEREKRLALIIANYKYEDSGLRQLVTPVQDAEDLAQVLRDPAIGEFDEVSTLINRPSGEVQRAIARFFAKKNRNDLLVLYFSGHGLLDYLGHLYLAVRDTERDLLSATAIPATFVTDEMDSSRSRRQVLILDCCHSGAFARTKGALGDSVGTAAAFEGTGYGRVVLTATDTTQYAWEGDQVTGEAQNSIFTHYLIEGLRTGSADADADGWITLDELYDYVYERVVNETPRQTPRKWVYEQQGGKIVIARSPKPAEVRVPRDLLSALEGHQTLPTRLAAMGQLLQLTQGEDEEMAQAAQAELEFLVHDENPVVRTIATTMLNDVLPTELPPSEGEPPVETEVPSSEVRPTLPLRPSLAVDISADSPAAKQGDKVTWTVTIINDGDVGLRRVLAVDKHNQPLEGPFNLDIGEKRVIPFKGQAKAPREYQSVTVTAEDGRGGTVEGQASLSVEVKHPLSSRRRKPVKFHDELGLLPPEKKPGEFHDLE